MLGLFKSLAFLQSSRYSYVSLWSWSSTHCVIHFYLNQQFVCIFIGRKNYV